MKAIEREEEENLKHQISVRTKELVIMILPLVIFLIIWEWAGRSGRINPVILPTPLKIGETLVKQIQKGKLQSNLIVSGLRILRGFVAGSLSGLAIGVALGLCKPLEKAMTIVIGIIRPIPIIAWIPLFILWLGLGETSKTVIIGIGCFWPIMLNTVRGIQSTDKKLLEVSQILEKSRVEILFRVIFPSAMPSILTGIRLGVGSACMGVTGAEMLGASSGIGFLITYGRELAQPALMMLGVLILGLFGLFMDVILLRIEASILKWNA